MIQLVLQLLLAVSLLPGAAHAADLPDPLGLRGINLGMTPAEVRKLGHPDKPAGKIELVCTGDKSGAELHIDLDSISRAQTAIGVKVCSFHVLGLDQIREAVMDVARHEAIVRFYFTPRSDTPATSERLFFIQVSSAATNFHEMLSALVRKYGEADSDIMIHSNKAQRRVRSLGWGTGKKGIAMTEVSDARPGDTLEIAFGDVPLVKLVDELTEKAKKSAADKL